MRASLQQTGRGQAIEVISDPSQPQGGILFDISRGRWMRPWTPNWTRSSVALQTNWKSRL